MQKQFFPKRSESFPKIYAYKDTNPQYEGLIKVGFTSGNVKERVVQQYPIIRPGEPPYRILLEESAMRNNGTNFTDHDIHRYLRTQGILNEAG